MAGKRTATSELNHDNWEEEYEHEDAGTFKRAPEDILQRRVIKTAKRRNPISSSDNGSAAKNAFSGFGGFTKTPNPSAAASPFAFLANLANNSPNNSNGISSTTSTTPTTCLGSTNFKMSDTTKPVKEDNREEKSADYYAKLKGLNESVTSWIKTHVDKNPLCILTPIFKDYEKYLGEIDSQSSESKDQTKFKFSTDPKSSVDSGSIMSGINSKTNENPFISSGDKLKEPEKSTSSNTFSFASTPSSTIAPSTGFSFGTGQPFQFANVIKPISVEEKTEKADEEDDPPKVEFKPVVEDGSIFTKRCKVFVKKDGNFGDRGVGQLFLKPVSGSEKIQLIVRADTNLGNLLLNFILSESIPIQRMGKNNVMLVCIPTPDAKPPPSPILLRVKTGEEADELLNILEKHKK